MTSTQQPVADRHPLQNRTLAALGMSAVFSRGATSAIFAVAVLAIKEMLGNDSWAGLSTAGTTVGSGAAVVALAAWMQRRGRTTPLTAGLALGLGGALIALLAVEVSNLWLFLVGMVLIGVGSGTSNLSRYAAADLASPDRRSIDISWIVFAGTFGAVFFPLLIGWANDTGAAAGLNARSGGFIMGAALFLLSSGLIGVMLRPDPLVVAGGLDRDTQAKPKVAFRVAVGIAWSNPLTRLAFVALVISQAVMVMVMAMTPLHMEAHGHSDTIVGQVISAHTLGMFAFAPFAGWISDKFGRVTTIVLAGFTLTLATILTALAGEAPKLLMFPGLYLLGLGWSFGIVAGSALLTESVDVEDRVAVQGAADMGTQIASGAGAIASGFVVDMAGFHILSLIGMAAAIALVGQSWFENRLTVLPGSG